MAPSHKYEDLHLDIYDNSRKYDDLLDGGHDDVSVILKCPPRRVSIYVHALSLHREFLLQSRNPLL